MVCLQTMRGLDYYSRYVIGWKLCGNMRAEDVTDTLDIALAASGCDSAKVLHKPRLLSDNGSSYIAGDLAEYLEDNGMKHVRGARCICYPAGDEPAIAAPKSGHQFQIIRRRTVTTSPRRSDRNPAHASIILPRFSNRSDRGIGLLDSVPRHMRKCSLGHLTREGGALLRLRAERGAETVNVDGKAQFPHQLNQRHI